jgi:hypothetical protein
LSYPILAVASSTPIFSRPRTTIALRSKLLCRTRIFWDQAKREIYLGVARFKVVLRDPFEEQDLDLLWPMRVEYLDKATVLSFIVLERDVRYLFDRPTIDVKAAHVSRRSILAPLPCAGFFSRCWRHLGYPALPSWEFSPCRWLAKHGSRSKMLSKKPASDAFDSRADHSPTLFRHVFCRMRRPSSLSSSSSIAILPSMCRSIFGNQVQANAVHPLRYDICILALPEVTIIN